MLIGCEQNEGSGEMKPNEVEHDGKIAFPSKSELEDKLESELDTSLQESLSERRSVRDYSDEELSKNELAALMWAAQGITEEQTGYRTAPSAGATYPMEVYAVIEQVDDLEPGIYRYLPEEHSLEQVETGSFNEELEQIALGQDPIGDAQANLVITSVHERVTSTYGDRGERYAKMEAGHISQNIYLTCTALDLGTVAIGAFEDEQVSELLQLQDGEYPMYIMPVGN